MVDNTLKKIDNYNFSMKNCLGQGSYARVFKGKKDKTEELVAIKMIDKSIIENEIYLMNGLF